MSIRSKLTIMFLAIALIPLLLVTAITFDNYKDSLKANRLSQLENLAGFKADKIETYFAELKTGIKIVQNSYIVKKSFPALTQLSHDPANPKFLAAKKMLDEGILRGLPSAIGLFDIMLVNPDGTVYYTTIPEHFPKEFLNFLPDPQQKAFKEGKNKIYFSDIFFHKTYNDKPCMLITGPARDFSGNFIGVIAAEVDMSRVYKIIQDVTGLGNTGETLVAKKIGNEVLYLNPLRHNPQAALSMRIRIGDEIGMPMQQAVQGGSGVGLAIDYRGKNVVAAWRYIPSLDWGLVAKIDADEAFAEVENLKKLVLMILVIISVLSGIMAFSIARSVAEPIKKLSQGSKIIGSGNLDYKFETNTKDEIGQLAGAFDKMVRDVKKLGFACDTERQRLYSVLETLPVYVVLLSENYHVPFANKFFRERFGESGGKRCYEYLFNRNEACENCETYKVMKTNAPHHWEWLGPDERNYDIYDFPFIDTDGSRMILEMGIDITEQKRAQEALRSASQYSRSLIEASLDPLITISAEGKITDVNEGTIKATGVSREQLIGTDFSIYFTEPQKAEEGYRQVFEKGFVIDYSLTIRHKDGRLIDVLYNASVYKDTRGNVLGVFAAARDVTVQKQAEAELRRHKDNLEALVKERTSELETVNTELLRSNENLEQFAYVASHDLQEPLRVMASYSQLLEKRYKDKLDNDANDFIEFIVDAASRMQKLITDLLSYSRAGRNAVTLTKVDFNEVLRKVIASMSATIESNQAKITFDNLPEISASYETSIIQVFQNLLGNALKFRSEEPPAIHVTARQEKTEWVFSIQDNGIGIEPQYTERIFQIFQRLHSKHEYSGTGIGLSICKKIVENSGGRIWVESEPGKGSTFYFTLPKERRNDV